MVSFIKSVTPLPPQSENTLHRSFLKNVFYLILFIYFFHKIHEYNSESLHWAHIKNSTVYEKTLQKKQK